MLSARFTKIFTLLACLTIGASAPAVARDLYVSPQAPAGGNGESADAPLGSIGQAIKLAKPGDTIHLTPANAFFRDNLEFINRSGEPGKPITIEGNGATLSGSEPLVPADWEDLGNGLYRNTTLYVARKFDKAVIVRYFFLFDGTMQLMNRSSKGPSVPLKKPEDLQPGEWTFVEADGAFYLRIEPGKSLAEANIEHPLRSSGIMLYGGNCEHITIRNVTVTHFYNDGCNLHSRSRDILLENVRAIDNGDDGFSAHGDCHATVRNFYARGNSTGVCNVNQAVCTFENLHLDGNVGYEFYALFQSHNTVRNGYIASRAARPVVVGGSGKAEASVVTFENVWIDHQVPLVPTAAVRVHSGATFKADRLTTINLPWVIQGTVELRNSLLCGDGEIYLQKYPTASWTADRNRYDLKHIRLDQTFYTDKNLAEYQSATGQDRESAWVDLSADKVRSDGGGEFGADRSAIPAVSNVVPK